jgi:hypothetical protein
MITSREGDGEFSPPLESSTVLPDEGAGGVSSHIVIPKNRHDFSRVEDEEGTDRVTTANK